MYLLSGSRTDGVCQDSCSWFLLSIRLDRTGGERSPVTITGKLARQPDVNQDYSTMIVNSPLAELDPCNRCGTGIIAFNQTNWISKKKDPARPIYLWWFRC